MSVSAESANANQRAMRAAMGVAVVMVGQLVASRALRDGFFLTHFEPTVLPSMVTSSSILSIFIVLGSSRILRHLEPAKTLPRFFLANAVLYFAESALAVPMPKLAAVVLYLHTMSLSAVVVSGFWSVVNERFDPHVAKRLIGRIGAGASFGGMLGGAAAWLGASVLDIPTMILILGGLNLACAAGVLQIGGGAPLSASPDDETSASALEIFQESAYLRHLALLVALGAFGQVVYDYVFKVSAAERFDTSAELVSFFALFYLGISVLTFVSQSLIARRALERFGLAVAVGTLPGSSAGLGLIALLFPGLSSAIAMRGGIGIVENSLFRSGYELLYTPVLPEKKRPTKALIDVGGDKVGTAIGGVFTFLIVGVLPGLSGPFLICAGIAASLAALYVTRQLHHGYVSSLAERLRAGALSADEIETADATTRATVSDTIVAMERSAMGAIGEGLAEALKVGGAGIGLADLRERLSGSASSPTSARAEPRAPEPRPFVPAPLAELAPDEIDATLVAIAHLRSGDEQRILATLARHNPLPRELVSHVIPILEDDETAVAAGEAAAALRRVAPVNTGALLDAVLQSRTPLPVRRRLCDILGRLPTQRSANGLIELLGDANFELRFRAASNLLKIHRSGNEQLRIPTDLLFDIAAREAGDCRRRWRSRVALDSRITTKSALESVQGRRVVQGMTFISTLLLTVLEAEPLQLAIRALTNDQAGQRGTGLEYLENVLPKHLLSELRPLLEDAQLTTAGLRSRSAILAEIVGDGASGPVDLAALRAHIDAARRRSASAASRPT